MKQGRTARGNKAEVKDIRTLVPLFFSVRETKGSEDFAFRFANNFSTDILYGRIRSLEVIWRRGESSTELDVVLIVFSIRKNDAVF